MGFWSKKKKNTDNFEVTPEEQKMAEEESMREAEAHHQKLRQKNQAAAQTQAAAQSVPSEQEKPAGLNTDGISDVQIIHTDKTEETQSVPAEAEVIGDSSSAKTIGESNVPVEDFNNHSSSSAAEMLTADELLSKSFANQEVSSSTTSDSKVSLASLADLEKQSKEKYTKVNEKEESKEDLIKMNSTTVISANQSSHLRLVPTDDKSQTIFEVNAAFADWFVNDVISTDKNNHIEDIEGHKNEAISYLTSVYLLTSGYTSNTNTKTLDNGGFLTEYKDYIHDNIYYLIQSILAYDGTEEAPMGTTWKIVNTSEYLHKLALMAFEGPEAVAKKHKDYQRAVNNFVQTVGHNDILINYNNVSND